MTRKRTSSRGEIGPRPLFAMAFVLVQIILPFASPFAVGSQASQTTYSAVTPSLPIDSVKSNVRASTGVSLQASASAVSPATNVRKKSLFRQIASDLNPFQKSREYVKDGEYNVTLPSRLLFRYATPLVDTASERQLDENDAFTVPDSQKMGTAVPKLKSLYEKRREKAISRIEHEKQENEAKAKTSQSMILLRALLLHQRRNLILTGALRLLNTAIQAFPALLVARLLRLVESGDKQPPIKALTAAISLVAVLSVKMVIENQYFHKISRGATEVRGSLSGMIFDKSLRLPGGGGGTTSSSSKDGGAKSSLGAGGVLNLMQSDASILEFAAMQLHTIWDGPLQIAMYTTLLYRLLGPSVLYGLAVLLLTIPLNSITLRVLNRMSRYENEAKDARTKRTSESIANMKLLKLQAWEGSFEDDIRGHRSEELSRHSTRGIIRALNQAISNAVPALVLVVTLAAYAKTGRPIVASTIFTAISLFNQLRFPLFFYPMLIDSLANGYNALQRVSSYLSSEEITPYVEILPPLGGGQGSIEMKNGNFLWSTAKPVKDGEVTTRAAPALCDVNLKIKPGEVVAVVGEVGSGKSALIKGLLGELAPVPRNVVDQTLNMANNQTEPSDAPDIFEHPSVVSHGNIGYCSQESWLAKGTIRDAVVFGREYDEEKYQKALRDAGLDGDIVDATIDSATSKAAASRGVLSSDSDVGESGSSLSGGQRARVALARALYAGDDTKVFLLDDPLAALDASVGSTVFERLTKRLRNSKSATVLVTNDPSIPRRCDRVILMGKYNPASSSCATIIDSGTYDQLLARGHDLRAMAAPRDEEEDVDDETEALEHSNNDGSPMIEVAVKGDRHKNTVRVVGGYEAPLNDTDCYVQCDPEPFDNCQALPDYVADQVVPVIHSDREKSVIETLEVSSARNGTAEATAEKAVSTAKPPTKKLTSIDDTMAKGAVPARTYFSYLKSVGNPVLIVAMIASFLTSNGAQFFQQYTVAKWTELGSGDAMAAALGARYLRSLVIAAGVVSVSLWLRSFFTMRVGVRASEFLHSRMLSSVFKAPMSFFDATPSGQLLSRFGKETETVDRAVPDSIGSVLFCFLQIAFSIGALAGVITPAMMLPLFLVGISYTKTMGRFRPAARDMKGAESKSRSPIYTHFGEAIRGQEIIRSVPNASNLWAAQHQSLTDRNLSVLFAVKALDRWLSIRLETLGNIVVFTSAVASVYLTRAGKIKAGASGWGLTQALSVTGLLTWAVRTLTDLESNMMSVVRVEELTDLDADEIEGEFPVDGSNLPSKSRMPREPSSAGEALIRPRKKEAALPVAPKSDKALLETGWPWKGNIVFKNASMRYNEVSPLVLKNVTLGVPPGTTLGVVGRTGSGKSSLLLTLFRLVEIEPEGAIEIDGVDIRSVSAQGLRESLSIIPQDPVLFAGTVMYNLDATGKASPEDAWAALEAASPELANQFRSTGSGLDTYISEGGKNLSQGQRQLICLARALLRKSRILVMDEATSSVDSKTDAQVQDTIRREFVDKGVTVITVAHRLDTVLSYDKIAVLGDGYLLEFGSPKDLLKNRNGDFKALVDADRLNKKKGAKTEVLVTTTAY